MKNISRIGLCFLLAGSLVGNIQGAEPSPRDMAEKLGYRDLLIDLPKSQGQRSPRDPDHRARGDALADRGRPSGVSQSDIDQYLTPRLYDRADPVSLLPTLLRLQRQRPDSPKITRKLALICLESGLLPEARQWFARTWQLDRNDLAALWNLGALSWQLDDIEAARAYLGEYYDRDPNSPWGRVAANLLEQGSAKMNKAFAGQRARVIQFGAGSATGDQGRVRAGAPQGPATSGTAQVLIIDGQRTDPDRFGAPANVLPVANPLHPVKTEAKTRATTGSGNTTGIHRKAPPPPPAEPLRGPLASATPPLAAASAPASVPAPAPEANPASATPK